jgi:pantoate--beta-alanine ligase
MYPNGEPWVEVVPVTGADRLCGASRPGHFAGVLTVVAKLFGIVAPDVAVFGQKDYQQLVLIRRMVADLEMRVRVLGSPIVREPDGLAMSSRNAYLSAEERQRALAIYRSLRLAEKLVAEGERRTVELRAQMERELRQAGGIELQYIAFVKDGTAIPVDTIDSPTTVAIAAKVGKTRLIDNCLIVSR